MRHNLKLEGEAFALRPVELDDSDFIVEQRNDPRIQRFINRGARDVGEQQAWLNEYFERPGDYYFMIVDRRTGAREGMVAIYEVDEEQRIAEWGRWVVRPGSLAAVESALLMFRIAFEQLGLEMVYSRTVCDNKAVASFHDSSGVTRARILHDYVTLDGTTYDSVEHHATRENFPEVEARLAPLARMIAQRRNR